MEVYILNIRRIAILAFIVSILIIYTGCTAIPLRGSEKVLPPNNKLIPLEGTWKFIDRLDSDVKNNTPDPIIDNQVTFKDEEMIFIDDVIKDIRYTAKRVRTEDFFLYQYRTQASDIGIEASEIDIISVSTNTRILYEFAKIDDKTSIVSIEGGIYLLKSGANDSKNIEYQEGYIKDTPQEQKKTKDENTLQSGLLLGLRRLSNLGEDKYGQAYRTLWIRSENRILYPTYETVELLVPRQIGFWDIGSSLQRIDGYTYEGIYAYPSPNYGYPHAGKGPIIIGVGENVIPSIAKNHKRCSIQFVGNDYIAVEDIDMDDEYRVKERRFRVLPIDNVDSAEGVGISDIVGKSGRDAFINSALYSMEIKGLKNNYIQDTETYEDNFTLSRRNGHWAVRGRLPYKRSDEPSEYLDFDINLIPSEGLISYDELSLPWNTIKRELPGATDAYTSPNEDILVVLDIDNIYIYSVEDGQISNRPLGKINLYEGEEVVMAEWAIGSYVKHWDGYFKGRDPLKININ